MCKRFRRHYLPDDPQGEVKLEQDDVNRICNGVVEHEIDTNLVAEQFEISQRRVQQLVMQYREHGNIPPIETPGRSTYADHPDYIEAWGLAVHEILG